MNSKSCPHAFVPDKMLEIEIDRKRLIYIENLKFMPFVKSFHFMPFGNYAIFGKLPSFALPMVGTKNVYYYLELVICFPAISRHNDNYEGSFSV